MVCYFRQYLEIIGDPQPCSPKQNVGYNCPEENFDLAMLKVFQFITLKGRTDVLYWVIICHFTKFEYDSDI